jgi:DNA-binding SARP family transcriptional activator
MTRTGKSSRPRAALLAALALAGVIALVLVRPPWPHLTGSITSPLTTSEVEQTVLSGAWGLALLLVLVLLARAVRNLGRGSPNRRSGALFGVLPTRQSAKPGRPASLIVRSPYFLTIPPPPEPLASRASGSASSASASRPSLDAEVAEAMALPSLSIAVLGPLAIEGISRRIKRAATYELIAYLALHAKGASRDELVEAIWPAQDPARTRPRFWQSVTEARKALGDAWVHKGERYELDRSRVRVDLDELDRLLAATSGDDVIPDGLEKALALWRGEPLEGSDYLWADGEIRSLRATLLDLLERVGRLRLAGNDPRGALQLAEQAITLDRLHEASWRLALQAEHALGLRQSITRRYDELTRSLDQELGLEPTRETRVIYRQLLGQT